MNDDMRREPHARLVDDMIEAYVQWREECICVHISYNHWTTSRDAEACSAFSGKFHLQDVGYRGSRHLPCIWAHGNSPPREF
jgi:hypothetical protein